MSNPDEAFEAAYHQQLIDTALLLVLWDRASNEETGAGSRLRLMKLAFLFSRELAERRAHALGVQFYRWKYGPMSNQVYDAWERLGRAGLMEEEENWEVTDSGTHLSESFYDEVLCDERNAPVKDVLEEITAQWRSAWSAQPLMTHIYDLPVSVDRGVLKICDMEQGDEFELPVDMAEANVRIDVDNAWIETLAISFSPSARMAIAAAEADFLAGRYHVA